MKAPPTDDHGPRAPLLQTLALARPAAGCLALATLLGAGALVAAIGLIATSAWLISRSSQRPQESAIAVAIVGVQFFALSRGLCRYAERLVGHDARLRGGPPFAIALIVGAATVLLVWLMLPAAGAILLVALLLAGVLVPWLTSLLATRTEARQAAARGELTAAVVDLLEGTPELIVNGAMAAQLQRTRASDAELTNLAHTGARTAGIGQGLTRLCSGLAMWGALMVGVAAVHSGRMNGVLLAGVALIPLVAFELVTDL